MNQGRFIDAPAVVAAGIVLRAEGVSKTLSGVCVLEDSKPFTLRLGAKTLISTWWSGLTLGGGVRRG